MQWVSKILCAKKWWLLPLMLVTWSATQAQRNPDISVSVKPEEIEVGDHVELKIKVIHDYDMLIIWPDLEKDGSIKIDSAVSAEVLDKYDLDSTKVGKKLAEIQAYKITVWEPGRFTIPPFKIEYKVPEVDEVESELSLPTVLTVSGMEILEEQSFKGLKDQMDMPFQFREIWREVLYASLAALALILLGVGLYFYFKYRKKPEGPEFVRRRPEVPPHIQAMRRLNELKEKQLWRKGEIKEYYSELTDIIKEYLEFRYDILAIESTTEELKEMIQQTDLSVADEALLFELLGQADLVKFAKITPEVEVHDRCLQSAYEIVSHTQQKEEEEV